MLTLSITRPDDWHVHLRDEAALADTIKASSPHFARVLVMPNLKTPLTSLAAIKNYRTRLYAQLKANSPTFTPYFTFYLNEDLPPNELVQAKRYPFILGAKLYPANATTNSETGAKSIRAIYPLLDILQEQNFALQIHGEVTHGDIFSREARFIKQHLIPIIQNFPKLRIVLEHISTRVAVDFITQAQANIAATITPHHLLYNRNHLLVGGIKPHYYCLPILKRAEDQRALMRAATSGNNKFFAGTDSAPHAKNTKESACGCAGVFSAPIAVAMYAEAFDRHGALQKLDAFLAKFGAEFYQLPITRERLTLIKRQQQIPESYSFGNQSVVPIAAGLCLQWSIDDETKKN